MLRKRNCGRLVGPEGFWFQLHRALNPIAAILTIIAFAIAVHVIREEDGKSSWKEYTHFIVGF
jgi:hypothetical protein